MLLFRKRQAENEVAHLKQDLFGAQQAEIEANQIAQRHKQLHLEVLVKLEQVSTEDPAAANQADRALIQSLEQQLNSATQQLHQLRAGHAPSAAEEQLDAQQPHANEQLKALRAECNTLRVATMKVVAERDASRSANLKLQMESLTGTAASATITALREWCMKAEARMEDHVGSHSSSCFRLYRN